MNKRNFIIKWNIYNVELLSISVYCYWSTYELKVSSLQMDNGLMPTTEGHEEISMLKTGMWLKIEKLYSL